MQATMELCISCKGCRRECPTGVDMARMKIEFLHHYHRRHALSRRDRLIAFLPRYAGHAARFAALLNLRNRVPFLAELGERSFGFSAARQLPQWSARPYRPGSGSRGRALAVNGTAARERREAVLFVDTFDRYFEPENARAAERVLTRAGYTCVSPDPAGGRPLCCGRTFLAVGLVDEARGEARRTLAALAPYVRAGTPIVGLEPSCLLTLRDEFPAILPGDETRALAAHAQLFEEFAAAEHQAGRFDLASKPLPGGQVLLHGHCHQKAFATLPSAVKTLQLIPDLKVETFDATCCGMAGAFGYEAEHYAISMQIGELGVLPKMRAAPPDTLLAACGTSCRHQIADATGREARHIVRILDDASA
jgi:Fe-S oxidoreductase